jgi:hypothetical protein
MTKGREGQRGSLSFLLAHARLERSAADPSLTSAAAGPRSDLGRILKVRLSKRQTE